MTTCAGFKGAFYALNGRMPTDQEIFDEAVREGVRRCQGGYPTEKTIAMQQKRIEELERENKELIDKGFVGADTWSCGDYTTGGYYIVDLSGSVELIHIDASEKLVCFVETSVELPLKKFMELFPGRLWKKLPLASKSSSVEIIYPAVSVPEDDDGPWIRPIGENNG